MRILLMTSLYPPDFRGGAEKAAFLLAKALVRKGNQVSVVTLHKGKKQTLNIEDGVRVHRIPLDNCYWPFGTPASAGAPMRALWHLLDLWNSRSAARVGKILDIERPEVVHSHNITGFSVSVWQEVKKRNIRLVHTMHDYYLLCERSAMYKAGRRCVERCLSCKVMSGPKKRHSDKVDAAICVSKYLRNAHTGSGYFQRIDPFVLCNVSEPAPKAQPRPAKQAEEPLVFGFMGKVISEKGIDVLLAATKMLRNSNWRLRIAGTIAGEHAKALQAKYADPRIEWLGFQSPESFYQSVDVVVIPSQFPDPFPYVAIESLELNKSVIGAMAGGIPEILELGKRVALFEPDDVAELARLMDRAIASPEEWLEGGFTDPNSVSLFTEERIVALHQGVYENLLSADQATLTLSRT